MDLGWWQGLEDLPNSLEITNEENRVMGVPDGSMHRKGKAELEKLLGRIKKEPQGFVEEVDRERRNQTQRESEGDGRTMKKPRHDSKLDQYRLLSIAGRGSFSSVYKAKRRSDKVKVALKHIALKGMENTHARVKCMREIGMLKALSHPNIINCHEYFETHDGLFVVLEWGGVGDLKQVLARVRAKTSRLSEQIIWDYFRQISDALSTMHRARIIHRDVKPANIFVMENGSLKLGDLGLSRALGESTLKAYSKVGTPLYMSPEVLQGEGHDFKSDTWGMGCVLYEMVMLHTPFEVGCKSMRDLFARILSANYTTIPDSNLYSQRLRRYVHMMLIVDANARPDMITIRESLDSNDHPSFK